jgi:hypothetical protein
MNFPPNITALVRFLDAQKIDDSLSVLHTITALSRHLAVQNASYEEIADIVEKSEPLTMDILAAAGGSTRGSSPTVLEALLQLGNTRIKKIVTLHSFRQIHRTFQTKTARDVHRNNVWSFSYSHALLSQRCHDACGNDGDAYLPALLERTGVILFGQFFFDAYSALIASKPDNCNRYDWEMMHLGYNSIEVGARYLEHLKIDDIAARVRAQLKPRSESDEIRYFARHLALAKVPVFFDDVVYDEEIIARVRERLGPEFEEGAVLYLKSAFQNSLAA